jgi:hypothetical protein
MKTVYFIIQLLSTIIYIIIKKLEYILFGLFKLTDIFAKNSPVLTKFFFIKFEFTFNVEKDEPKYVIYLERLTSESMKPSKLKQHLVTKHPQFQHKEEDFFKRYKNLIKIQKNTMRNFTSVPTKVLAQSLEASYLIAKTKKPHSIGESLVLPVAIKIVSIMHGESYVN